MNPVQNPPNPIRICEDKAPETRDGWAVCNSIGRKTTVIELDQMLQKFPKALQGGGRNNNTPLHGAAWDSNEELVKHIAKRVGPEGVNLGHADGATPLFLTCYITHAVTMETLSMVRELLANGADVNLAINRQFGDSLALPDLVPYLATPLWAAVTRTNAKEPMGQELITVLLKVGAEISPEVEITPDQQEALSMAKAQLKQ